MASLATPLGQEGDERDLNDAEAQALARWQDKEQEMDGLVDEIGKGLDLLGAKLDAQNELLDAQQAAIQDVQKEAVRANAKFESANKRLKDLIDKYRAPSKVCMDVCLGFLVIVLLGILVKQIVALKGG